MDTAQGTVQGTVQQRIDAWEASGLIDAATAQRLRAAEAGTTASTEPRTDATAVEQTRGRSVGSVAGSFFGPPPTIVEVFGYLGAGFFIAAWAAFLGRIAGTTNRDAFLTAGTWIAAAVLFGVGLMLRGGDARRRRGAGVAFLAATLGGAIGTDFLGQLVHFGNRPAAEILDAVAALAVASAGRRLLPSVTTQVGVLAALTGLGGAILGWLESVISGVPEGACCVTQQPAEDVFLRVVLPAIGWLLVAIGIGLLGLAEGRAADAGAGRRAVVTRFWAGILAVIGLSTSVFRSGSLGGDQYGRLVQPWLADALVVVLAAILLERAVRRDSVAFLVAAAIALVTALTDFNFSYLSDSRDLALVAEGVILLGVGFIADRLRRRLGVVRSDGPPAAAEAAAEAPQP